MAATVKVYEKNGATGTNTDLAYILYGGIDSAMFPGSFSRSGGFSCSKCHRMAVSAGTFTQITDLVVYTDGNASNFGTDIKIYAKTASSYTQPSVPTSTSGYTDFFTYTSASPLSLGAGPYTSTAEMGSYLETVMTATTNSATGETGNETFTWQWDEI